MEQLKQIDAIQKTKEEEEQRNYEQLIQLEQWEHIAFLLQQLKPKLNLS